MICETIKKIDPVMWIVAIVALCVVGGSIYLWCIKAKQRDRWMTKEWAFLGNIAFTIFSILLLLSCISMWIKTLYGTSLYSEEQTAIQQSLPQEDASWHHSLKDNFWSVYYHFVDPGNQDRASQQGGRLFAGVVALLGIFSLNGLLVSGLISAIDRRKERWMKGEVRYKRLKNHIVIIGGHAMVPDICKELFENAGSSPRSILIQTKGSVEELRAALLSTLTPQQEARVIIYYGDRTRRNDIEDLRLDKAQKVYLIGEDSSIDGKDHDTYNMTALNLLIEQLPENRPEPLEVYVMFEYQTTFSVFQFSDITAAAYKKIDFRPFNYYEMWAQKIFAHADPTHLIEPVNRSQGECRYPEYLPLDTIDAEKDTYIGADSPEHVHLVVIGMSQMGVTLALEAAHIAHYPNARTPQGPRTRITFIDPEADRESGYLMRRYHNLFQLARWRYVDAAHYASSLYADFDAANDTWHDPLHKDNSTSPYKQVLLSATEPNNDPAQGEDGREFFIDIEWEFIKGGMNDRAIYDYLATCANHPHKRLTVAVCLEESHQAIAAGLYLPEAVYEQANQVLVYQRQADAIISNLTTNGGNTRYRKVKPFGMFSLSCDLLFDNDDIARLINYVYSTGGDPTLSGSTPEAIKKAWKDMLTFENGKSGAARRWSNIYHANAVRTKLRSAGWKPVHSDSWEPGNPCLFKIDKYTIRNLAIAEHNRWNVEQLLMHYRPLTQDEQDKVKMRFDNYQQTFDNYQQAKTHNEKSDPTQIDQKNWEKKCLSYKKQVFKQFFKDYKNDLKRQMHHPDLCSYQRVAEIDDTQHYDQNLARALPYIVHRINAKRTGQIQSIGERTKEEIACHNKGAENACF